MEDWRLFIGDFDVVEGTGDAALPPAINKKQLNFQHFSKPTRLSWSFVPTGVSLVFIHDTFAIILHD